MLVSYRPHVDVKKLSRNTKVVAEALARVIYNLTEKVNAQIEKMDGRLTPSLFSACDVTCPFLSYSGCSWRPADLH